MKFRGNRFEVFLHGQWPNMLSRKDKLVSAIAPGAENDSSGRSSYMLTLRWLFRVERNLNNVDRDLSFNIVNNDIKASEKT